MLNVLAELILWFVTVEPAVMASGSEAQWFPLTVSFCRQPWYYGWGFNLPRGQALLDKWNQIPDNTDILVTHCPPLGEICTAVFAKDTNRI